MWRCGDKPEEWLRLSPPFQIQAHEGPATGIAFAPAPPGSEPWFVTSSVDGLVRLWSLSGRRLAEDKNHKLWVRSVSFKPNTHELVLLTTSFDATVKLRKIDSSIKLLRDLDEKARTWLGDWFAEPNWADRGLADRH